MKRFSIFIGLTLALSACSSAEGTTASSSTDAPLIVEEENLSKPLPLDTTKKKVVIVRPGLIPDSSINKVTDFVTDNQISLSAQAVTALIVANVVDDTLQKTQEPSSLQDTEIHPYELQEEIIGSPSKPEAKKIKIEQGGFKVSPNMVLKGVVDVMVDGKLEGHQLEKANPVEVLIDDYFEKTDESIEAKKRKFEQDNMPQHRI
jgi:hypothetical protein